MEGDVQHPVLGAGVDDRAVERLDDLAGAVAVDRAVVPVDALRAEVNNGGGVGDFVGRGDRVRVADAELLRMRPVGSGPRDVADGAVMRP